LPGAGDAADDAFRIEAPIAATEKHGRDRTAGGEPAEQVGVAAELAGEVGGSGQSGEHRNEITAPSNFHQLKPVQKDRAAPAAALRRAFSRGAPANAGEGSGANLTRRRLTDSQQGIAADESRATLLADYDAKGLTVREIGKAIELSIGHVTQLLRYQRFCSQTVNKIREGAFRAYWRQVSDRQLTSPR